MNTDDLAAILATPLFRGIGDPDLTRDIESLPYRMVSHESGRLILLRNDSYNDLIILVSGVLEAFQEDRSGHQFIVESLKAPAAVATAILFAPKPLIPVSLKAADRSKLFILSRDSLLRLCSRHPGVLKNLLSDMGARTAFLANKLRFQAFTSIRQKLAVYLLEQHRLGHSDIRVNKEHLAELFGVSRPSLSRVCRELVDRGVIRIEGRRIVLRDVESITRLAEPIRD